MAAVCNGLRRVQTRALHVSGRRWTQHGNFPPAVVALFPTAPKELHDCAVAAFVTVQWGEMDAFQHVNNVRYFDYFQAARIAWHRAMQLETGDPALRGLAQQGPHQPSIILGDTHCRYKRPLEFPDSLLVGVKTAPLSGDLTESTILQTYKVLSQNSGRVAAEGSAKIVVFDYKLGKKVPIPAAYRAAMNSIDSKSFQCFGIPGTDSDARRT